MGGVRALRVRDAAIGLAAAALGLAGAMAWPASAKDGVLNVRFGGDQSETRVVIELDKAAKGRLVERSAG
jgi:N-acetylmuramoyl-L-alanine amidase